VVRRRIAAKIVHVRVVLYFLLFYIKRARRSDDSRRRLSRGGTGARSVLHFLFSLPLGERTHGGEKRERTRAPVPPQERQRGGMAKETSSNLFRAFFDLARGRVSCACNRIAGVRERKGARERGISIQCERGIATPAEGWATCVRCSARVLDVRHSSRVI